MPPPGPGLVRSDDASARDARLVAEVLLRVEPLIIAVMAARSSIGVGTATAKFTMPLRTPVGIRARKLPPAALASWSTAPESRLAPTRGREDHRVVRTAILMPAFNEQETLGETLRAVRATAPAQGGICVFLVDDGSRPGLDPRALPAQTEHFRIVLARHITNLGQGAALETARRLALRQSSFDVFVTMDADGQHSVDGLAALVSAVREGADMALGSRFLGGLSKVPRLRRWLIQGARLVETILTGSRLSDAHNGFRAFSRAALDELVLRQNRMAHATEITLHVHRLRQRGFRMIEVPVRIEYTERSLRKGQRATGAIRILRDLLHRFLFEEG